jgi:hypothetical protein
MRRFEEDSLFCLIRLLQGITLNFRESILKMLKVPKREIFVTELFTLSDPIWIGDLRT